MAQPDESSTLDAPGSPGMRARPGHLIRRAHQLHDALWAIHVSRDVTPTQFAVLSVVAARGRCDQSTIVREASLDSSTAGSVVLRLVQRGWIRIENDPRDRRRKVLELTPDGAGLHASTLDAADSMTDRLVAPLDPAGRAALVDLLEQLITGLESNSSR